MTAVGEKLEIHWALDTVAHLAMDEEETERAVRIAGTAARLRETSGTPSWPVVQRSRERWLAAANEALGEEAFQAAWREGHAMEPQQAITYALEGIT
jgi:hypothetical protein